MPREIVSTAERVGSPQANGMRIIIANLKLTSILAVVLCDNVAPRFIYARIDLQYSIALLVCILYPNLFTTIAGDFEKFRIICENRFFNLHEECIQILMFVW